MVGQYGALCVCHRCTTHKQEHMVLTLHVPRKSQHCNTSQHPNSVSTHGCLPTFGHTLLNHRPHTITHTAYPDPHCTVSTACYPAPNPHS
jgi:hypothetical protein